MGNSGKESVKYPLWERIAEKTERLYELVLSGDKIQDYGTDLEIAKHETKSRS